MNRLPHLVINTVLIALFFYPTNILMADDLTIVINEIGASEGSGHEWLEILNTTDSPIDITGWKFWEAETNHGLTLFAGDDLIINPGEYAIIAQKADVFVADYPGVTSTIIDSSWSSLKESGEEVGLKDSDGNFVEVFTYISAPNFSLQRINSTLADYTENNWQEHADSNTVGFSNNTNAQSPEPEPEEEPETEEVPEESFDPALDEEPKPTPEPIDEPEPVDYAPADEFMPADIVINEIVSDPSSSEEEWIELYSTYTFPINLNGWIIEDGSERQIELSGSIIPRTFYVIEELKFQLNNSGDIITLYGPSGKIIDQVTYGTWDDGNINDNAPRSSDPQSLARKNDGKNSDNNYNDFDITSTPTKGLNNLITKQQTDSENNASCSFERQVIINEILPNPSGSDSEN
ncbi:lamin tail domain-containing protein, partial [Patescibacteria group bacterium]|nr:lamin tail domain-containing protein [Patescibacteria group bacterium]